MKPARGRGMKPKGSGVAAKGTKGTKIASDEWAADDGEKTPNRTPRSKLEAETPLLGFCLKTFSVNQYHGSLVHFSFTKWWYAR